MAPCAYFSMTGWTACRSSTGTPRMPQRWASSSGACATCRGRTTSGHRASGREQHLTQASRQGRASSGRASQILRSSNGVDASAVDFLPITDLTESVAEDVLRIARSPLMLPKINVTSRLADIKTPTLVIVGEHDPGTPPAMAREIHEHLPGSELVVSPSAAHISNLEQPQAFDAALGDFLARRG